MNSRALALVQPEANLILSSNGFQAKHSAFPGGPRARLTDST